MLQVNGTIGSFGLVGGDTQVFDMPADVVIRFFRAAFIKQTNLAENSLGIYSFLPVGADGKAKLSKLNTPHSLFQSFTNCATWNPKGRLNFGREEINTTRIEFMGEQCTDSLFGDCFEKAFGTGNEIFNMEATPESRALLSIMISAIYDGLGNSMFDLSQFGSYSIIDDANTNGWWDTESMTDADWADFYGQNYSIDLDGHITLIENVKATGLAHFNVDIPSGDVSGDQYTGSDVTTIFDACIDASKRKFRTYIKSRRSNNEKPVFLVSQSIFDAYEQHLISTYVNIPESFYIKVDGELQEGTYKYKGLTVAAVDEWAHFDERVGVNTHRVVLTAPGNHVIAHDVAALNQFDGVGMRIERSPRVRDKGRIDMNTVLRIGTAIADTDFMVNASRILTP